MVTIRFISGAAIAPGQMVPVRAAVQPFTTPTPRKA
jgi:hypothetical protein